MTKKPLGVKTMSSGRPGQFDFPDWQVTFHSQLSNG